MPLTPTSQDPDLSASEAWLQRRPMPERKQRGQWLTPFWVADKVLAHIAQVWRLPASPTVLDPACGDARWLIAAARHLPGARLIGWDNDPLALEAARLTLHRAGLQAELHLGDALAPHALPQVDLIVGNPPWVRVQNLPKPVRTDLWSRYQLATNKGDLYACFVERCLARAAHVALALPSNWLSLGSFTALRAGLEAAGVDALLTLPPRTFKVTVSSLVLLVSPQPRGRAGALTEAGLTLGPVIAKSPTAWSLEGPLPQLPGAPLGDYVTIHMGVVCGDYPRYVHRGPKGPHDQPTCRGRQVQRWSIEPSDELLTYLPRDMLNRKPWVAPKHAGLFDVPQKIVVAGASLTTLRAALDTERRFPLDSCYVILPKHPEVDLHGVLGLLLSPQVGRWYAARFKATRVKGVELRQIPVPPPSQWAAIRRAAEAQDEAALSAAVAAAYQLNGG